MDLRVLGPLSLRVGGQPVRLGPQLRILLIALLLARGEALPGRRLIDLLWSAEPPDGAPATLRSHIYHLRAVLADRGEHCPGASVLVTGRVGTGSSYMLHIDPKQVDAARFEQLLTDGRHALHAGRFTTASSLLSRALLLWRGEPLADAAGRPFAAGEIGRLKELHRSALVAHVESDIRCGLHDQAMGELKAMLTRWPDDEALYRLLVISLRRSGRLVEAARACRQGIEMMLDQGLDASALQALQQQVLRPPRRAQR